LTFLAGPNTPRRTRAGMVNVPCTLYAGRRKDGVKIERKRIKKSLRTKAIVGGGFANVGGMGE
jgi:hypothetical protein